MTNKNGQRHKVAGFEDEGRQPLAKDGGQPLQVGKGKEMDCLLELPEGNTALLTLILVQ